MIFKCALDLYLVVHLILNVFQLLETNSKGYIIHVSNEGGVK